MQDKYKVYNLCLERLYDASLFEGKVIFYFQMSWIVNSIVFDQDARQPILLMSSFCFCFT
jgi:hypothetical protein